MSIQPLRLLLHTRSTSPKSSFLRRITSASSPSSESSTPSSLPSSSNLSSNDLPTTSPAPTPAPHRKAIRPKSHGQNLSERYLRLEHSLRSKSALSRELAALNSSAGPGMSSAVLSASATSLTGSTAGGLDASIAATGNDVTEGVRTMKLKATPTFRGFTIPQEPIPPADDECCMSGCAICIYDLHEESLEAYHTALASLRVSLTSLGVPEDEWPESVKRKGKEAEEAKERSPVLSAFEEMERRLEAKKLAEAEA